MENVSPSFKSYMYTGGVGGGDLPLNHAGIGEGRVETLVNTRGVGGKLHRPENI